MDGAGVDLYNRAGVVAKGPPEHSGDSLKTLDNALPKTPCEGNIIRVRYVKQLNRKPIKGERANSHRWLGEREGR